MQGVAAEPSGALDECRFHSEGGARTRRQCWTEITCRTTDWQAKEGIGDSRLIRVDSA